MLSFSTMRGMERRVVEPVFDTLMAFWKRVEVLSWVSRVSTAIVYGLWARLTVSKSYFWRPLPPTANSATSDSEKAMMAVSSVTNGANLQFSTTLSAFVFTEAAFSETMVMAYVRLT